MNPAGPPPARWFTVISDAGLPLLSLVSGMDAPPSGAARGLLHALDQTGLEQGYVLHRLSTRDYDLCFRRFGSTLFLLLAPRGSAGDEGDEDSLLWLLCMFHRAIALLCGPAAFEQHGAAYGGGRPPSDDAAARGLNPGVKRLLAPHMGFLGWILEWQHADNLEVVARAPLEMALTEKLALVHELRKLVQPVRNAVGDTAAVLLDGELVAGTSHLRTSLWPCDALLLTWYLRWSLACCDAGGGMGGREGGGGGRGGGGGFGKGASGGGATQPPLVETPVYLGKSRYSDDTSTPRTLMALPLSVPGLRAGRALLMVVCDARSGVDVPYHVTQNAQGLVGFLQEAASTGDPLSFTAPSRTTTTTTSNGTSPDDAGVDVGLRLSASAIAVRPG